MKTPEYQLVHIAPKESNVLAYPNHDRANDVYSMFITGYCENEIADFLSIDVLEVNRDLMYVNTRLSPRQIISHNNERARIILQRQNSEDFRRLMAESLRTPALSLLAAGISPAGILKEYREATGMVQKAEPLLQINTQINNSQAATTGIQSAEDVIRRVLDQINQDAPENQEPIDVEAEDLEGQPEPDSDKGQIPDDDE